MTKITIYRTEAGWSLSNAPGATPVEAELADGYRLGEGLGGASAPCIFGRPGQLGMKAKEAIDVGAIRLLE
jgi:hypothetical protein